MADLSISCRCCTGVSGSVTSDAGKVPGWIACPASNQPHQRAAQCTEEKDRYDGIVPHGVLGAKFIDAEEQCRQQAGGNPIQSNSVYTSG